MVRQTRAYGTAFLLFFFLILGCAHHAPPPSSPFTMVLGIAQDGGYPQAGCNRPDCVAAWQDPRQRLHVASLAIVDPVSRQRWILDATPDFPAQLRMLDWIAPYGQPRKPIDGILLTHAHIGHYLGLAHLGREVMGAQSVPVYAMPRMRSFLESNGPWDQLVRLKNIDVRPLSDRTAVALNERISVTPFVVPHRDEYSETVAFLVQMPGRAVLWLPDIDKWERWQTPIETLIERVDVAYLDATFFDESELPGRSLQEIPHPTITESMARFASLPAKERAKIRFVHLNQSNPALREGEALRKIRASGMNVAREEERF